jgi:hypothetical protein
MAATAKQIAANRENALRSAGPTSREGKTAVARNAVKHGILGTSLLLQDEDPSEFQALLDDLSRSLRPVGALELALAERIAVSLWRQRRLVRAETAAIELGRQPHEVARRVSDALDLLYEDRLTETALYESDPDEERRLRETLRQYEALRSVSLTSLSRTAPLIYQALKEAAAEEGRDIGTFVEHCEGGIEEWVADFVRACREDLQNAERQPLILALASLVRSERAIPERQTRELLAKYQVMLDNQLYKAMKALRETQEWRLKTLEGAVVDAEEASDAA